MGFADVAELIVLLKLKDQISGPLKNIDRNMKGFAKSTDSAATKIGKGIGVGLRNMATLAVAGAGALGTVAVASTKWAGDFEAQLNTINTVARETPQGLAAIGVSIRKIAKDTGTSLEDLTAGYYDLVSAGIKTADAQKVLVAANTLAIGGLSTTAEAVDLLTTAINTYGGDASKAGHISDVFAKSIERGKVTAAGLAQSFATVGPIAAASKIEIEELAAAYARLTASGVPAAEAATQVRSAIVALTRRTADLEKLEKQTGKSYLSIAGKKGLVEALNQLRTDAKKAGVPLIDLLGRVEGLNFTLATTGPNFAAYNADLAAMGKATGTAAAQMAERQQGLNFQLSILKANVRDAGITIGNALLPQVTSLTGKLNALIQGHEGDIKRFGETLGKAFGEAFSSKNIAAAEKFAREVLPTIADGLRLTASVAKGALDAFNSLPNEVKSIAIAALVGNKLTGGLVASGIGDIAKNALSGGGLLGRGATPANPVFVADVAGGLGGKGLGGKLGGGALGAAGVIGASVVISGITVAAAGELANAIDPSVFAPGRQPLGNRDPRRFNANGQVVQNSLAEVTRATEGTSEGMRQFATELQRTGANLEGMRQSVLGVVNAHLAEMKARLSLFRREKQALGGRNQLATLGSGNRRDATLVAEALATKFAKSQAPFYQNAKNQTRALDGLKALQARFIAQGDTKSAAKIGGYIRELKGAINRRKPTPIKVTIQNSTYVSIRDQQSAQHTAKSYGRMIPV